MAAGGIGNARQRSGVASGGAGASVVKYLARYVGSTVISDGRIVCADDKTVTFKYTDSATQERRQSTVTAAEFMRRYLQHVLPPGQYRMRYFGWMHPSAKRRRMKVETLLAKPIVVAAPPPAVSWHLRYPHCTRFALVRVGHVASPGTRTTALSPMTLKTNPRTATRTLCRLTADSDRFARRVRWRGQRPSSRSRSPLRRSQCARSTASL